MKAQSDTHPPAQIKSRGKTQVNFNVREVEITDEIDSKPRTAYEYDVVIIEGEVTRDKIVSAILTAEHSIDAQVAIVLNKMNGKSITEYTAYQAKRTKAKEIADTITE